MRARMAISASGLKVELREVALRNKPEQMLAASPKGTVPVLITVDGEVVEESLDIMHWALEQSDPQEWLSRYPKAEIDGLVEETDGQFKYWLDRYKYADRYPENPPVFYREKGELFLQKLELRLLENSFLSGDEQSLADNAIFPFIRQFSKVDTDWFESAAYPQLRHWLRGMIESKRFRGVMKKHKPWSAEAEPVFWEGE